MRKRWVKVLMVVIGLILIASLSVIIMGHAKGVNDEKTSVHTISTMDNNEGNKMTLSHQIDASCLSYYENGEEITVDIYIGDYYEYLSFGVSDENVDYKAEGYPMLEIISLDAIALSVKEPGLIFNGEKERLVKKYGRESLEMLNITNDMTIEDYHKETIRIKFEDLEVGENGTIAIRFGWACDNAEATKEPLFSYHAVILSYYKSDRGIGLSFLGWETARDNADI